jgi:hypothetical protein
MVEQERVQEGKGELIKKSKSNDYLPLNHWDSPSLLPQPLPACS